MDDLEYNILQDLFSNCMSHIAQLQVDVFIYLKSDPKIILDRIHQRGRKGENHISLEYLERKLVLHLFHSETNFIFRPP